MDKIHTLAWPYRQSCYFAPTELTSGSVRMLLVLDPVNRHRLFLQMDHLLRPWILKNHANTETTQADLHTF
jgi:hypothetical protein